MVENSLGTAIRVTKERKTDDVSRDMKGKTRNKKGCLKNEKEGT